MDEFRIGRPPRLSRPVAVAYLTLVGLMYGSCAAGVVLALLTGRTSWRTGNPWLALPVLGVIALVWTVLVLVDSQLHPGRSLASRPLRPLVLLYGGEVPTAWRSVRR
ncbi:hypothetical protein [Blastococcus capsensis]|uniref:hypothetical protein n=1 Tax=Blastococcus capsensis TaxID=1564163 RepID=UPI00253F732A|nr:hypothetical protein [Blastococcus capsensis]